MTDPSQWQQNPPQQNLGQYQVTPMNQGWMQPLSPVLPQELPPERPPTITAAMWIWIIGAVLSVALPVVMLFTNQAGIVESVNAGDAETDQRAGELLTQVWAVMTGIGMLVAAIPFVIFAVVMRNGQNWARILLTVLGALGIMTMVMMLLIAIRLREWQLATGVTMLTMGLTVAAIVLMYLPASNRFVR